MTSFEQPDAGLLVEHLLPSLLGANHSPSQELQERNLFFGELGTALETLRGRLTVISSPPRGAREDSQYPWLWRYISNFTVGSKTRAVQHAKLWAFHWQIGNTEVLELRVSSTNLTPSAFKSQLQACWQVTLPLGERAFQRTRRTWGKLVPFLVALGESAGSLAATRVQRLVTLLERVECPADATFIASVPGTMSAARQLAEFGSTEIHVLTPTIGEWNEETLAAWSADVGVALKKIHLKWISETHPWADPAKWSLPRDAYKTLLKNKVSVECIPNDARFTKEHRDGDKRWSHAKLYLLRTGKQRWLLVTSANWSPSAWGAGNMKAVRNFELGVAFRSDWIDLEDIVGDFEPHSAPYLTEPERKLGQALQWGEASWDGKRIALCARSADRATSISAVVSFTGGTEKSVPLDKGGKASMPWNDAERTPLTARFTQGAAELAVNILDLRSPSEFAKTPLPEVDQATVKALREAFLLQRYGGPVADSETISRLGGEHSSAWGRTPSADYAVQTWIDARAAFSVVDRWRAAHDEAKTDDLRREHVRRDGEELRDLYARKAGTWAELVAQELAWRLKEAT